MLIIVREPAISFDREDLWVAVSDVSDRHGDSGLAQANGDSGLAQADGWVSLFTNGPWRNIDSINDAVKIQC